MLSAGGQCGRWGISLNHRCDPEEHRQHDPWNDAHSSNERELTFPPPFNAGCLATNLRLSVKSTAGGRIFDGVGILHNFLEIFSFSGINRVCGVYKKMEGKANAKITFAPGRLALTIALTDHPSAEHAIGSSWQNSRAAVLTRWIPSMPRCHGHRRLVGMVTL